MQGRTATTLLAGSHLMSKTLKIPPSDPPFFSCPTFTSPDCGPHIGKKISLAAFRQILQ